MWFYNSTLKFSKDNSIIENTIEYNSKFSYSINGSGRVYFYPNGRVSFLSILITSGNYTRKIIIASTGRTRFVSQ